MYVDTGVKADDSMWLVGSNGCLLRSCFPVTLVLPPFTNPTYRVNYHVTPSEGAMIPNGMPESVSSGASRVKSAEALQALIVSV